MCLQETVFILSSSQEPFEVGGGAHMLPEQREVCAHLECDITAPSTAVLGPGVNEEREMLQFGGNRVRQNKTRDQAHHAETPRTTSSICFKCVKGAKKLHLLTHLHGCATAIPGDMDPDTKPLDGTGVAEGQIRTESSAGQMN